MKTILITGGNGYLGSHIVKALHENFKVIVLEKGQNHERLEDCRDKIIIYDIAKDSLESIFQNSIDIIIHTATLYGRNSESAEDMLDSNFNQPLRLLEKAIQNGVSIIINTDTILNRFTNLYALTKKQFVDWLKFRSEHINVVNLELEHFYGPGASKTNFITQMARKMLQNEDFIDLTEGKQKRDFLYIDDLVKLFVHFVNKSNDYNGYHNFEVGSGENHSIREVVELIHKITSSESQLNFGAIPLRKKEIMESNPDLTEIQKLNWRPAVGLIEGLQNIVEFEKNKLNNYE